jgi:hypothetical protein
MTKHQEYFNDMISNHKKLFDEFKDLHDNYEKDPKKYQDEFNEKGQEILEIIRRTENMLCSESEGGSYGKYSGTLADKFWEPVRLMFPKIDFVGVKYS